NAGDLDACMELYAEDAVQRMHDGTFEGRSAIRERLARDLTACPDAAYTVGSFVEQGDSFADEWAFAGTQATAAQLAAIIRGHWGIDARLHWVRDMDFDEDRPQIRTAAGPRIMASLRNLVITILRLSGPQHRRRPALPPPPAQ